MTRAQTDAGDLESLDSLNTAFIRAVHTSDAGWFDAHLAADFMNSNADGTLANRAEFLTAIARPCPLTDFRCDGVRIRLLGETAIIHGRTLYGKPDGQPGAGRYTDIYARREGRWLCVAAHVTRG